MFAQHICVLVTFLRVPVSSQGTLTPWWALLWTAPHCLLNVMLETPNPPPHARQPGNLKWDLAILHGHSMDERPPPQVSDWDKEVRKQHRNTTLNACPSRSLWLPPHTSVTQHVCEYTCAHACKGGHTFHKKGSSRWYHSEKLLLKKKKTWNCMSRWFNDVGDLILPPTVKKSEWH